jgi:hypothetical protein
VSSSDDDDADAEDDDEDFHEHKAHGCIYVLVHDQAPPPASPPPPRVSKEVSGQIYNGQVTRDDTDDMVNHVVYNYFKAADNGEPYDLPPELTEQEQLVVIVLISKEGERRAFPGYEDALALSVVPPPPPGPPPVQPPRTPPARTRLEARAEPWDAWPGAAPGWPAGAPLILGWAPGTPTPPPGPPLPPGPPPPLIADWPWP